jgi:hypothetical protein
LGDPDEGIGEVDSCLGGDGGGSAPVNGQVVHNDPFGRLSRSDRAACDQAVSGMSHEVDEGVLMTVGPFTSPSPCSIQGRSPRMPEHAEGPLSDDEFRVFIELLRRFCAPDLDQFELWRLGASYGKVSITISRKPAAGVSPETYDELTFPPD